MACGVEEERAGDHYSTAESRVREEGESAGNPVEQKEGWGMLAAY